MGRADTCSECGRPGTIAYQRCWPCYQRRRRALRRPLPRCTIPGCTRPGAVDAWPSWCRRHRDRIARHIAAPWAPGELPRGSTRYAAALRWARERGERQGRRVSGAYQRLNVETRASMAAALEALRESGACRGTCRVGMDLLPRARWAREDRQPRPGEHPSTIAGPHGSTLATWCRCQVDTA